MRVTGKFVFLKEIAPADGRGSLFDLYISLYIKYSGKSKTPLQTGYRFVSMIYAIFGLDIGFCPGIWSKEFVSFYL